MKVIIAILCLAAVGAYASRTATFRIHPRLFRRVRWTTKLGLAPRQGQSQVGRRTALRAGIIVQFLALGSSGSEKNRVDHQQRNLEPPHDL